MVLGLGQGERRHYPRLNTRLRISIQLNRGFNSSLNHCLWPARAEKHFDGGFNSPLNHCLWPDRAEKHFDRGLNPPSTTVCGQMKQNTVSTGAWTGGAATPSQLNTRLRACIRSSRGSNPPWTTVCGQIEQ